MKTKLIIPSLLFVLAMAPVSSHFEVARALTADENFVVNVGDSIAVEDRTLIHNGESKVVSGQIIFPDGSSKSGRSFVVTSPGAYQIVYSAYFGLEEERETVTYTCYRKSGDFFSSSEKNNQPSSGEYTYNTKTTHVQGAVLNLKTQATFTLNEILDFNTFDPNTPFFEFIIDPSIQGESDIESFTVRLTDIEDSSNFVDITITDSGPIDDDGTGCYVLAGASNQYKTGYEWYGGKWILHIGNFGSNVASSFRALPLNSPAKTGKIYFNYAEKQLEISAMHGTTMKGPITDLDDEGVYGSAVWDGFKTGKARLSVFATSMLSNSARLIVPRAGSVDLSQLVFEDHVAPTINVDYEGQSPTSLPNATVNRPYKIFDATVTDNYDVDLPYTTSVTYVDSVNNKVKDISVINGTFIPKQTGVYSINYKARDIYGNVGTRKVNVTAINDSQSMTISISPTSLTQEVYTEFALPKISDTQVEGGSGKPTVTRRLVDTSGNELPIENDKFIPTETGTYYVYYTAIDYIGNVATAKMTINVQPTSRPVFVGNLVLPRVLIKGHTYSLPTYQAVETVNNKSVFLNSDIYVNNSLLSGGSFVAGDNCTVTYKVTGSTGNNEYSQIIPVIDGNESQDQTAYFYGNFDSVVENAYDVTLSANHDASALFAGVLPYDNLTLSFAKVDSLTNYQYVLFKFSEVNNPLISLTFKVRFAGENAFISLLNSTREYELPFETRDNVDVYSFSFNNASKVLTDINYKVLTRAQYDDNGNLFSSFDSGLYLDISLQGVSASSAIKMLNIDNQALGHNDFYLDGAAPIIIFKERLVNEQEYNSDANIPVVEAFDILGEATVTITVKGPDGSFKIKNLDATIKHSFKLDAFGSYLLTYRAEDNSGNNVSYPRKITVFDNVAPTLTVKNNLKESYKINSEIKIPSYTISDNLGKYTLNVYLILPNDEERLLIKDIDGQVTSYLSPDSMLYNPSFKVNSNTFRAEQYGTYRLRYVAYDDAFNKAVQEITFIVK